MTNKEHEGDMAILESAGHRMGHAINGFILAKNPFLAASYIIEMRDSLADWQMAIEKLRRRQAARRRRR